MKIKSIAAVGAIGVGMGLAGLVSAGTASAAPTCESTTPPFTPARAACVAGENVAIFTDSANPANQLGILINGTTENPELGLKNQPSTFVNSVAGPG